MTNHLHKALMLSAALLFPAAGMFAQKVNYKPFVKEAHTSVKTKVHKASTTTSFEVVVEEHFSKFTAGTETEPDKTLIVGTDNSAYEIQPQYLETPGWTGDGIWQAGGACYLHEYDSEYYGKTYGYISTKATALYGDLKISFRAKRTPNSATTTNLWVAVCDDYYGPVDNGNKEFVLTTEWENYEFATNAATFNDNNIVQFAAYEGEILIDDIKIERAKTKIDAPFAYDAINHSTSSFTAHWSKVEDASEYLLSVYYMDYPETVVPEGSYTEDFEGVKSTNGLVDTANPGYTEGWTIDVSTNKPETNNEEVITTKGNFSSGKQGIVLGELDDYILSPITPAPISKVSFWCKPSSMEEEDWMSLSMICVQVLTDGEWYSLGNLPNYYFQENGGLWEMDELYIPTNSTQLKIFYLQQGNVKFYIDDVTVHYKTQKVPQELFTDKVVADTCYTVESYDNTNHHYYYVKARNAQASSDKSYNIWVDGLVGLKPTVKEATEVTTNSFVANWEEMPNADTYKVSVSKQITGTGKEEVVLYENFDNITVGTIDNPEIPYTSTPESLGNLGYTKTDWMAQLPQYANGMAGAQAANPWLLLAGVVGTPKLDLDNQDGIFNVAFKAYMTAPTDVLWVMLLNEVSDTQAAAGYPVEFKEDKAGYLEGNVTFDRKQLYVNGELTVNLSNIRIAFMSQLGEPFFIDEVKITQKYAEGEVVTMPYCIANTEENFYKFENLDEASAYSYSVNASAEKDFYQYTSNESDSMIVNMVSGVEDAVTNNTSIVTLGDNIIINTEDAIDVKVYNSQGMLIASANNVTGIAQIPCAEYKGQLLIVKAGDKVAKLVVK